MSAVRIKQRFLPKFSLFRANNQFIDLKLRHGTSTYQAHSLVLAKNSAWFAKTLKEMEICAKERVTEINIPEDPDEQFETIIKILYTNEITISIKNAPALLKIATFYEIPHLQKIIEEFIRKTTEPSVVNDTILFYYASKFIEFGLISNAVALASNFAQTLDKLNKPADQTKYTDRIFQEVKDGRVVAAVLLDEKILKLWSEETRVALIDRYNNFNPEITDAEKEALANFQIVNWASPTAYQYLVKYRCHWLPARVARPLYDSIFKYRRANTHHFEKDIENASSTVSRWYPFSWATQIANAVESEKTPEVELINFITTLGGLVHPQIDSEKYGLINPNGNQKLPDEELCFYEMRNAFKDDDSYYQATLPDDTASHGANFIVIELGKSCEFQPTKIVVDMNYKDDCSESLNKLRTDRKRHYPKYIAVPSYSTLPGNKGKPLYVENEHKPLFEFEIDHPFNKIYFNPPTDGSCIVYRVRLIKIFGSFLQIHG